MTARTTEEIATELEATINGPFTHVGKWTLTDAATRLRALDAENARLRAAPPGSERVTELRAWAENRIRHCREQEAKFGAGSVSIEASTERRALQATLAILGFGESPPATTPRPGREGG